MATAVDPGRHCRCTHLLSASAEFRIRAEPSLSSYPPFLLLIPVFEFTPVFAAPVYRAGPRILPKQRYTTYQMPDPQPTQNQAFVGRLRDGSLRSICWGSGGGEWHACRNVVEDRNHMTLHQVSSADCPDRRALHAQFGIIAVMGQPTATLSVGSDGIAVVTLQNPPVNALHPAGVRTAMEAAISLSSVHLCAKLWGCLQSWSNMPPQCSYTNLR